MVAGCVAFAPAVGALCVVYAVAALEHMRVCARMTHGALSWSMLVKASESELSSCDQSLARRTSLLRNALSRSSAGEGVNLLRF